MTKEAGDLYAKVMVDTPGLGLLDYAVPADMLVAVGDRVVVGLRTRNVVGIVAGLRAALLCRFHRFGRPPISRRTGSGRSRPSCATPRP